MALLQRRLRCFYCGQRSASKKSTALREWRCEHCEAVNYLDENGEITDPPTAVTDIPDDTTDTAQSPFCSMGFDQTGLFCSKCVRNQHLLMKVLGSYLPDSDDPAYPAFEREYPRFRRNMEERYPQVCEDCEHRVNNRIRQTGYEAKADHLRRTMERSKISRAVQKARRRNWRSILSMAGALGFWISVAGQLFSDLIGTCELWDTVVGYKFSPFIMNGLAYMEELISSVGYSSKDLAGIALIAGVLSIWWNPKVHHKVEGLNGRILGLNQYYECQLIVMVTRFAVWAFLKDTTQMKGSLPPAIHAVMIVFMIVVTAFSQRLVHYDTRPLVLWSNSPVASPRQQNALSQSRPSTTQQRPSFQQDSFHVFPVERLGNPSREDSRANVVRSATPPPVVEDSMDWTPSAPQEIRPRFVTSAKPEITSNVVSSKSLFNGALPEAPRPPAWQLRNPITQKQQQPIAEPNFFQKSPTISQNAAGMNTNSRASDVFAPPRFFAPSDYHATTGLESLFDQTFTIRSPDDDADENAALQSKIKKDIRSQHSHSTLLYTSIRLVLLSFCLLTWLVDRMHLAPIPHDAVLISALIMNILFTGFNLLASLNTPSIIVKRVVYSLIKFVATVVLALCLGYNFSITFYQDGNLELCLKFLTALLAIEDLLGLISVFPKSRARKHRIVQGPETITQQPPNQGSQLIYQNQHSPPQPASPSQSFFSNQPANSFSQHSFSHSQSPPLGYGLYQRNMRQDHLLDDGSDASEYSGADSDAETTVTSYTNKSIRNMNPFGDSNRNIPPSRTPALGSGFQGLSLDDSPGPRRMTRSQTMRRTGMDSYQSRKIR